MWYSMKYKIDVYRVKRVFALCLSALLVCGLLSVSYLVAYADDTTVAADAAVINDIKGHWAEGYITTLWQLGMFKGMYEQGDFEPNRNITRAEFASLIARAKGLKAADATQNPFADISNDQWYCDDLMAAYGAGIIKGMSASIFGPNENVTRQDLIVMISRAYKLKSEAELKFDDKNLIADYALNAVKSAVKTKIIKGKTATLFDPIGTATRAETAKIIAESMKKFGGNHPVNSQLENGFDFNQAVIPFWDSDIMYNESVLMLSEDGGLPEAELMFTPIKIIAVRDSALKTTYVEGKDWVVHEGKIELPKGSAAASMDKSELWFDSIFAPPKDNPNEGYMTRKDGGYIKTERIKYFHQRQLAVTYQHFVTEWQGPKPAFDPAKLPRTIEKLNNGQKLNIVAFGDSITVGWNASGISMVEPYAPTWVEMIETNLKNTYPNADITLNNTAVGGVGVNWALGNDKDGQDTVAKCVTPYKPDLVVVAFGMNDGSMQKDVFTEKMKQLLGKIRINSPNTEIILVATMLPNPETTVSREQENFLEGLKTLEAPGVAVADMTSMHKALLMHKKYLDMTGNNLNHPNDFLVRVYEQVIATLLIPQK